MVRLRFGILNNHILVINVVVISNVDIMPKIIARENAEQLEFNANINGPGPMQAEEFTISEHELDSGIL